MIILNKAKAFIMEHVIEPAEASGGLVEIQDDTPKPTPVV